MFLAKLKISNFRGIRDAQFTLFEHVILLGNNNSGKSTIIDAIGLLLGKDMLVRSLSDWDFFGGNPTPADRIKITGVLTDFPNDNESDSKEWFNDTNGGIPQWIDVKNGEIFDEQDSSQSRKLCIEISFAARFNRDDLEFETIRYFSAGIGDPFEEEGLISLKRDLGRKFGFFLIPSKRNWERIISFNSEIFRKVIEFQGATPAQNLFAIRNDLRGNSNGIEKEEPFKNIVDRINAELKGFCGKDMNLSFLPTAGDIESTKQSITPFLLGRSSTKVPIGFHGSGLISLQTLLLLLEFGRFRKEQNQNFILAAEEPELHMHPGMHRRLVARMRGLSTQTIITTHSPEIAAYYKPSEIYIVETNEDGKTDVSPLVESTTPSENALMRLFTVYRRETSESLMNPNIIIPEGISEYYWLTKLTNAFITTEGWDVSDTLSPFGVVPTQDSNVVQTFKTINKFKSSLIPLVDGDAAGKGYVAALTGLPAPPKLILQLKDGQFLEHVIAWIIQTSSKTGTERLKKIFGADIDYSDVDATAKLLESKFKSYWKVHDELVELMISEPTFTTKVKTLISALHHIVNDSKKATDYWTKNVSLSTANTQVFSLSIF